MTSDDEQHEHEAAFDAPDAAQARVRDLLRAAPGAGPMPPDVVARLDDALAQARVEGALTSLAQRRRSRRRTLSRVLAAAAGIAVLAGGGAALFRGQGSATSSTAAGGGSVASSEPSVQALSARSDTLPAGVQVLGSGNDYAGGAASAQDRTLLGTPTRPTSAPTPDPGQVPAAEHALACTSGLGVDPATVVSVEIASWRSQPAAVVVHRTAEGREAVVVALDCTPGDPALDRSELPA